MSQERLDASLDIDLRSAREIVRIIQEQDALVAAAVAAEAGRIAHAIDQIADRMSHGGRLFYVGAGTSGRIAMLDASELPPTFGIDAAATGPSGRPVWRPCRASADLADAPLSR